MRTNRTACPTGARGAPYVGTSEWTRSSPVGCAMRTNRTALQVPTGARGALYGGTPEWTRPSPVGCAMRTNRTACPHWCARRTLRQPDP